MGLNFGAIVGTRCGCTESARAASHSGARPDPASGLGLQLLSARDPRRSDRARSRRLLELDLCRVLGIAGDIGAARPARRAADRSLPRQPLFFHSQPNPAPAPAPSLLYLSSSSALQ